MTVAKLLADTLPFIVRKQQYLFLIRNKSRKLLVAQSAGTPIKGLDEVKEGYADNLQRTQAVLQRMKNNVCSLDVSSESVQ